MRVQELPVEVVYETFGTSPDGLTAAAVRRRQAEFGRNEVERAPRRPLLLRFLGELVHFFALILWLAAALAFAAEASEPGSGMGVLGIAIVMVIVVNAAFSFWQEHRAERAIHALEQLLPPEVELVREGAPKVLPASELVPGDVIVLAEGTRVPADVRLVAASGLRVDMSTLTGESVPVGRDARPSVEARLTAATSVVLAGTAISAGRARGVVFATGMRTELGKIAHTAQAQPPTPSPMQREVAHVSKQLAILALAVGLVFFVAGWALGLTLLQAAMFGIGIIVANVPEGLLPTVTLALALASQRMAKRNALVRHLPAVEALGACSVICTDKTGTITQNRMEARLLWLSGDAHELLLPLASTSDARALALLETAANCHELELTKSPELGVGDPLELALVRMAAAAGVLPTGEVVRDHPFSSERRRQSVVVRSGAGLTLLLKGAPEVVLDLARIDSATRAHAEAMAAHMAETGHRVLAFARRALDVQAISALPEDADAVEQGLELLGLVAFLDPPRAEVPGAIARCRDAGVRVIMVTGDHPLTAGAICHEVGLFRTQGARVVTGDELRHLSDVQLQLLLDQEELAFARTDALDKARIVSVLRKKGQTVAVTGDGVNDAPALRAADIGVAMGKSGTDVARESAAMILTDDNFASIVHAIEEGRAVYANIKKFLTYILTSNVPELVPYLAFVLLGIPLPLTIIQILAVDLGTDMVPALGLGAEPPDPSVMRDHPRPRRARLLDRGTLLRAYAWLGLFEAGGAMMAFFVVLTAGGWTWGTSLASTDPLYVQATTACLVAIIVMQVMNVLVCRSPRQSAFRPLENRLIIYGIVIEITLALLIVYTPPGQVVFGTAPLLGWHWLLALPFALAMLGLEELRKWFVRGRA